MAKAFTTDYEHFADANIGILPYIAQSVKELIQSEETDKLHKLQEDIAFVADSLYDLLDEVDAAVTKYERLKNKMLAIEAAMQEKQNALKAMQEEMEKEFGAKEEDTPELVFDSPDGEKVVKLEEPAGDVMSDEMKALMDSMLTFENVVGSTGTENEEELLRESGLIFGDEIDAAADAEERQSFDIDAADDEGFYTDFDMGDEDVDDGYQPLVSVDPIPNVLDDDLSDLPTLDSADPSSEPGLGFEPEPMEPEPAIPSADEDIMNFLNTDDDFLTMFDDDDNPITDDELVMDDDEYNVIEVDDYIPTVDDEEDDETDNESEEIPSEPISNIDDDDETPSGFVDPTFF